MGAINNAVSAAKTASTTAKSAPAKSASAKSEPAKPSTINTKDHSSISSEAKGELETSPTKSNAASRSSDSGENRSGGLAGAIAGNYYGGHDRDASNTENADAEKVEQPAESEETKQYEKQIREYFERDDVKAWAAQNPEAAQELKNQYSGYMTVSSAAEVSAQAQTETEDADNQTKDPSFFERFLDRVEEKVHARAQEVTGRIENRINNSGATDDIRDKDSQDFFDDHPEYAAALDERLANADPNAARLYSMFEDDIRAAFTEGGAYYTNSEESVYLNPGRDMDPNSVSSVGGTFFHEVGHLIDDRIVPGQGSVSDSKRYTEALRNDFHNYVNSYAKENVTDEEIIAHSGLQQSETADGAGPAVDAASEKIVQDTARRDLAKDQIRNEDGSLNNEAIKTFAEENKIYKEDGSINYDEAYTRLIDENQKNLTDEDLNKYMQGGYLGNYLQENNMEITDEQINAYIEANDVTDRDLAYEKVANKEIAQREVAYKEIGKNLSDGTACDEEGHNDTASDFNGSDGVSDIFGGMSDNKAKGIYGHTEYYWDSRGETGVNKEAFAEMFAASMGGSEESKEHWRSMFPTAYGEYEKMVAGGTVSGAVQNIPRNVADGVQFVTGTIADGAQIAAETMIDAGQTVVGHVVEGVQAISDGVQQLAENAYNKALEIGGSMIGGAQNLLGSFMDGSWKNMFS